MKRIFGGKWNRAFRDERQSEDERRPARFTLFEIEAVLEQNRGQCEAQRWRHAGGDYCSHRRVNFTREQTDRESVGGLVNRPAHVERHHRAEDEAEIDRVRAAHAVEPGIHGGVERLDRRGDDINHEQPDRDRGKKRQNQNRLEALERGRQFDFVGEEFRQVAGEKPGNDSAEEIPRLTFVRACRRQAPAQFPGRSAIEKAMKPERTATNK